jgi:hypothetical protein
MVKISDTTLGVILPRDNTPCGGADGRDCRSPRHTGGSFGVASVVSACGGLSFFATSRGGEKHLIYICALSHMSSTLGRELHAGYLHISGGGRTCDPWRASASLVTHFKHTLVVSQPTAVSECSDVIILVYALASATSSYIGIGLDTLSDDRLPTRTERHGLLVHHFKPLKNLFIFTSATIWGKVFVSSGCVLSP